MRLLLDTHAFLWYILIATMPFHHRDPFDRLIVVQALAEQIAVICLDLVFDAYGVARFW